MTELCSHGPQTADMEACTHNSSWIPRTSQFVIVAACRYASLSDKREGVTVNFSIVRYRGSQYILSLTFHEKP